MCPDLTGVFFEFTQGIWMLSLTIAHLPWIIILAIWLLRSGFLVHSYGKNLSWIVRFFFFLVRKIISCFKLYYFFFISLLSDLGFVRNVSLSKGFVPFFRYPESFVPKASSSVTSDFSSMFCSIGHFSNLYSDRSPGSCFGSTSDGGSSYFPTCSSSFSIITLLQICY